MLAMRMERAKSEETRTHQYLAELEENILGDNLARWRVEEAQWKENVEHLGQDGNAFKSPYELKKVGGLCFRICLWSHPDLKTFSHVSEGVACFSCKEEPAERGVVCVIARYHRAGRRASGRKVISEHFNAASDSNAFFHREALLDILKKDNRGNLRDVTLRCDEFHVEVSHWQLLQEAYLEPLLADAITNARASAETKVR